MPSSPKLTQRQRSSIANSPGGWARELVSRGRRRQPTLQRKPIRGPLLSVQPAQSLGMPPARVHRRSRSPVPRVLESSRCSLRVQWRPLPQPVLLSHSRNRSHSSRWLGLRRASSRKCLAVPRSRMLLLRLPLSLYSSLPRRGKTSPTYSERLMLLIPPQPSLHPGIYR